MTAKPYPHILIVGAGLSGLTLAQMLRKHGISYEIFERDAHADARLQGWAIALHGPVLQDLRDYLPQDIGSIDQTHHLLPLDLPAQFMFYDVDKPEMRSGVNDDETGQIVRANRQRLRDWLQTFIPVQYDRKVVRIEEADDKVTVFFENGLSATGDFVIGAEGTQSTVRKHILHGQDVLRGLPVGSLVGEIALTGDDFKQQLELGHSAFIVSTRSENHGSLFNALNRVSPDGKTGYYYFLFHWVDEAAARSGPENPYWTLKATKEELRAYAKKHTSKCPPRLRGLVDRVPLEGYRTPGIVLRSVELTAEQLPPGRMMVIGDAAHSMTPFRGEAGVAALQDAVNLGRVFVEMADKQLKPGDPGFVSAMESFRDDMLARGRKSAKASNPVLEQQARDPNHRLVTCGKGVIPLPEETIAIQTAAH